MLEITSFSVVDGKEFDIVFSDGSSGKVNMELWVSEDDEKTEEILRSAVLESGKIVFPGSMDANFETVFYYSLAHNFGRLDKPEDIEEVMEIVRIRNQSQILNEVVNAVFDLSEGTGEYDEVMKVAVKGYLRLEKKTQDHLLITGLKKEVIEKVIEESRKEEK